MGHCRYLQRAGASGSGSGWSSQLCLQHPLHPALNWLVSSWPRGLTSRDRVRVSTRRGPVPIESILLSSASLLWQDGEPGEGWQEQGHRPYGSSAACTGYGYRKDSFQLAGHRRTWPGQWYVVTGKSLWALKKEELPNQNEVLKEVVSSLSLGFFK